MLFFQSMSRAGRVIKADFGWHEQAKACSTRLDTLRLQRGCQKIKIATAQPPFTRGPSEVFRIVDDHAGSSHKTLPRNRFLLHCRQLPLADAWGCKAPVGSNTETDDD
jgi:hypothetical protein